MSEFCHLHVHSHYSLLDGGNRIKDLVTTAKAHGMKSLALTDHGNLFGAVDFYTTCKAEGIKPILGMEAYISPTTRFDKDMKMSDASYHLLLVAMNQAGWKNLLRLSSRAYLEGFYYKPRIDREILAEFSEGLICTTACIGGEVPQAILRNDPAGARKIAGQYLDIFGPERFFIEVQNQGEEDQNRANPELIKLAGELGVGTVGTNDVHFLTRDAKASHQVLTCISTGKTLDDDTKLAYSPELYLKSVEEMHETLKHFPDAIGSTMQIAEMCDLDLDFTEKHLPVFKTPHGEDDNGYLRKLAYEGLERRFDGEQIPDDYKQRLDRELGVIEDKGYSSYFLIVNDFVQYARQHGIPSAPRGSGVATLLGYCLGIADVDPMQYGLLFERFTDPARQEDPDIDIDICQEGRGKVIQYVREKYGHVAQIITYGTLKAKAVIRDVGRVMNIPLDEVDAISKLVPEGPKVTLDKALETEPDLKKLYETDDRVRRMIDYGKRLEGLARHSGIHAAGVIVCDEPLEDLIPLCRQTDSEDAVTQWDGPTCEKAGMMKMDFLGLRTLTIIQRARELVKETTGKDIDPEKLPLDDAKVFQLFCEGRTDGVFQFESDGMKNVLLQMQPERIEGLIAANAMYRPGPMELIPTYCARKRKEEEIPSVHPLVDDLLAETYGIMAYQEQVMQVLNRLGKLPLNRALTLIKAISKKKEKVIAAEKPNFLDGAEENGIARSEAEKLFDLILKFAGYGFNKAHSTRYAIVAYQTAYFKVHYPRQFLAATLTFECGDTDKVVQYMAEARRMGIEILPPDINTCGSAFAVDGEAVRFGLSAVKGVGAKAVDAIVEARQEHGSFSDLYDFCENVDLRAVNKSTIEALIKCGAFDALGASRAAMTEGLAQAIEVGQSAAREKKSGQMSFFGGGGLLGETEADKPPVRFPDVEPWSETELLQAEKETLGFYITSHPLVKFAREIESLSQPSGVNLSRLESFNDGVKVAIGCMIQQVRHTFTKKAGKKMAMLTVEDLTGKADAVVFPRTFETVADLLVPEAIVFLVGTIDKQRERPNILVDEVIPVDEGIRRFTGRVVIRLDADHVADDSLLGQLQLLLRKHSGNCPLDVQLRPAGRPDVIATIHPENDWSVSTERALLGELTDLLGDQKHLHLVARKLPQDNGNGRHRFRRDSGAAGQNGVASEAVTRFN
ncbi:MAG: DNA polymerase III subunit alpha [Phycisphaerae bacterium]